MVFLVFISSLKHPASFKGAGFSLHITFLKNGGDMDSTKKQLEAFGVTVTIAKVGNTVDVVVTKKEGIVLQVSAPPEPESHPWSGCGVMC
jgi:hypothetical protein